MQIVEKATINFEELEGVTDAYVYRSEEEFLKIYPKPEWGKYRPQPYNKPEKYPALVVELYTTNNDNGPDVVHLFIAYDFEVMDEDYVEEGEG